MDNKLTAHDSDVCGARELKFLDGNLTYNEVELTGQKMNKELFDIQPSSIYRICIYNAYLYTSDFIPGESLL